MMEGPSADSEEKREPVSDIDTVVVDSLKELDPNGRLEKLTFRLEPSANSGREQVQQRSDPSMLACSTILTVSLAGAGWSCERGGRAFQPQRKEPRQVMDMPGLPQSDRRG